MLPSVFISYSSEDRQIAAPLARALRIAGFTVYFDQSIPPGSRWSTTLSEWLNQADIVLIFLSDRSIESDAVAGEVSDALERRRKNEVFDREGPIILPARINLTRQIPS